MDKATRIRWTILLAALCATVAAIFYPLTPAEIALPAIAKPRLAVQAPITPPKQSVIRGMWEPLLADPFAPRRWDSPAPVFQAPVVPVVALAPVAEVVVAPAGPPALPFRFVGQMNDSAQQVVYLAVGEQALLARAGEVLEGTYKVLAITPLQIEFEHIPTGQKQALVFPPRSN